MKNLALKWRPKRFDDLVGQDHNVRILANIVKHYTAGEELPAVFMFAGSRGTGKTTTARILAKVLNCEQIEGVNPCGSCDKCVAIDSFRAVDVLEIDAASNGGVDSVRALKEQTMYHSSAKVRVFIIDECHSMSREAYDALLKVLEEPPASTVFILCTTEPGKLPDTIRSRAMLFEFRRISQKEIVGRMGVVCGHEQISVEEDVLEALAKRVDGSMRDALIALTQLNLYSDGQNITIAMYEDMFGDLGGQYFLAIVQTILSGEVNKGLLLVADLYGKVGESFIVSGLIDCFRDMLIRDVLAQKIPIDSASVIRALDVLWEASKRFGFGDTRTLLDVMYIRLCKELRPMSFQTVDVSMAVPRSTVPEENLQDMFSGFSSAGTKTNG